MARKFKHVYNTLSKIKVNFWVHINNFVSKQLRHCKIMWVLFPCLVKEVKGDMSKKIKS